MITRDDSLRLIKDMMTYKNQHKPGGKKTVELAKTFNTDYVTAGDALKKSTLNAFIANSAMHGLVFYMQFKKADPFVEATDEIKDGFRAFKAQYNLSSDDYWDGVLDEDCDLPET